jgi:hypothetical protein
VLASAIGCQHSQATCYVNKQGLAGDARRWHAQPWVPYLRSTLLVVKPAPWACTSSMTPASGPLTDAVWGKQTQYSTTSSHLASATACQGLEALHCSSAQVASALLAFTQPQHCWTAHNPTVHIRLTNSVKRDNVGKAACPTS